jgi:hypothetical protein
VGPAPRNVIVVVLLAAAVYALPGGGTSAAIIGQLISIAFAVGIAFLIVRLYRENRMTIYGLGERHRALLYGALATLLFAAAAAHRMFDAGGAFALLWLVLVGGAAYALYLVWRQHREYA